jgi:cytochrome oxidase Cu insertion factor (SCO1/SenC/PrrC family)
MPWSRIALATALALGLAGCAASTPTGQGSATPTPSSGTVLDIAVPAATAALPLVDEAGRTFTLASLRGTTVVLVDFLTLCQEVCPLTSANVRAVSQALDRAGLSGDVRILETTVDPERDTPARLAAYQKLYDAHANWSLVTGRPSDIAALWKSFGVGYDRTPTTETPAPKDWLTGMPLTYDVQHQDIVFVLGPDGHERWLVDGTPRVSGPSSVPAPLQSFLSGEGRANESAPPDPSWTPQDVEAAVTYVTGRPVGTG